MSRAFVKEDDGPAEIGPVLGAGLPPGTPNLCTPWSAEALRRALAEAKAEREALGSASDGLSVARRARADARVRALEPYVAGLQVVVPPAAPERAGFGVVVTLEGEGGTRVVAIVGADEADPAAGRVSFFSPLARAIHGAMPGEVRTVRTPRGDEEWEDLPALDLVESDRRILPPLETALGFSSP